MRVISWVAALFLISCVSASAKCIARSGNGSCLSEQVRGRCLLEVGGKKYINRICNIEIENNGGFSIGADGASGLFAYVTKYDDGTAQGSWGGARADRRVGEDLGTLRQKGACWINSTAKVCAWH
jgi:hypothetical protein